MSANSQDQQLAFKVKAEDIQEAAKKMIGRELTESELQTAVKGVETGLSTGIDQILKTAIEEAVN